MKYVFVWVFLSFVVIGCNIKTVDKTAGTFPSRTDQNIGWLHGSCLAIKNRTLQKNSSLTLVLLEEKQTTVPGTVLGVAQTGEECFPLMDDRKKINSSDGLSFYKVSSNKEINLAVGYIDSSSQYNHMSFDYCTTTEGVLFKGYTTSVSLEKEQAWQGYYYLGYESEATCID